MRILRWGNEIQLMAPETMSGTLDRHRNNPLVITMVECAPYPKWGNMVKKNAVVDFQAFNYTYKD